MNSHSKSNAAIEQHNANLKPKILVIGTLLGAVIGLITAQQMTKSVEKDGGELKIDAGDVLRAGVTIFTTMKGISSLS